MGQNRLVRVIAIVLIAAGLLAFFGALFGGLSFAGGGFGNGWGPGSRSWLAWPIYVAGFGTALFLWFLGCALWLLAQISDNMVVARELRSNASKRPAAKPAASQAATSSWSAPATATAPAPAPAAATAPLDIPAVVPAVVVAAVAANKATAEPAAPAAAVDAGAAPEAADAAAANVAAADASATADEAAEEAAGDAAVAADATATGAAAAATESYQAPQVEINGYDLDEAETDNGDAPAQFAGQLPGSEQAARVAAEMAAMKPPADEAPPAGEEGAVL